MSRIRFEQYFNNKETCFFYEVSWLDIAVYQKSYFLKSFFFWKHWSKKHWLHCKVIGVKQMKINYHYDYFVLKNMMTFLLSKIFSPIIKEPAAIIAIIFTIKGIKMRWSCSYIKIIEGVVSHYITSLYSKLSSPPHWRPVSLNPDVIDMWQTWVHFNSHQTVPRGRFMIFNHGFNKS